MSFFEKRRSRSRYRQLDIMTNDGLAEAFSAQRISACLGPMRGFGSEENRKSGVMHVLFFRHGVFFEGQHVNRA